MNNNFNANIINESVLPEEATHFGDAADKRIWTKYSNLLTGRSNIFVAARFGK